MPCAENDLQHSLLLGGLLAASLGVSHGSRTEEPRTSEWIEFVGSHNGGCRLAIAQTAKRWPLSLADSIPPWRAWNLAVLYTALGDNDDALRWLNYEDIHCWVSWTRVLPGFETLWSDPRFSDLMEKKNLPWPRVASDLQSPIGFRHGGRMGGPLSCPRHSANRYISVGGAPHLRATAAPPAPSGTGCSSRSSLVPHRESSPSLGVFA